MSSSGHDGLRRQNMCGGLSELLAFLLNEPTRLGEVAPLATADGCTDRPAAPVPQSRVRRRVDSEEETVPGGGTTCIA